MIQNPTVRSPSEIAVEFHTAVPDPLFRSYLSSDSSVSTLDQLRALTAISLSNKDIPNITGIEYATSLTTVFLGGNTFTSAPIAALRNLSILNMSGAPITTIENLKNLVNLTNINVAGSPVSTGVDFSALVNIQVITMNSCAFNQSELEAMIDDLWANRAIITGCTINFSFNAGSAAAAISKASYISDLNAAGCPVTI